MTSVNFSHSLHQAEWMLLPEPFNMKFFPLCHKQTVTWLGFWIKHKRDMSFASHHLLAFCCFCLSFLGSSELHEQLQAKFVWTQRMSFQSPVTLNAAPLAYYRHTVTYIWYVQYIIIMDILLYDSCWSVHMRRYQKHTTQLPRTKLRL